MGFGVGWMKWMEAMVFNSHMSVLVNGSPTKKFKVTRGIRQGNPLSPFLFVLVPELAGLVRRASEVENFRGISIKVPDLGVNYHKSKLIGININLNLLRSAANFHACSVEDNNFTFLGIPIGSNPRRILFWNPLINRLKRRLNGWKGRLLSLGGRITLLKAVLSSLHIFFMSFYRALVHVCKEITRIQSNFLWSGIEDKKKIHWVRWDSLCLSLEKSGISLKLVEEFNVSLLLKLASTWWKDILLLKFRHEEGLFVDRCRFVLGKGNTILFWQVTWTGDFNLRSEFPDLYELSNAKNEVVAGMRECDSDLWRRGNLGVDVSANYLSQFRLHELHGMLSSFLSK
ncbi:uncharacterized protein LOC131651355 [Vicia villosa]|uniref:uncharacterized protein LOC131651355 n=1 Tax=Vicia villosa TaxID=3911 RepID=UPI00273B3DC8|nr:uncharacterized protein LOC131651355 [Vicia villosa]